MQHDPVAEKQASLRRYRTIATLLLLIAAAVFVATELVPDPGFWVLLIRAGAEAGLIGGLADWFAVSALFRRPLGLPIPHTGIIPRNKDRIGQGLGSFVERNFLAPELIADKLRDSNVALRISRWLGHRHNSRLIAEQIVALLPDVIGSLQDREVRGFFREAFRDQLRAVDLLPLFGRLLRLLQESGQHFRILDRGLELARGLLRRNEESIYRKVEERTSWWIPRTVDERVARSIIEGAEEMLTDLAQAENPARADFDTAVRDFTEKLEHSEQFKARVDEVKDQMLASPEMVRMLESMWDELRAMLLARTSGSPEALIESITNSLISLAKTLEEDAEAQARLNRRLEHLLTRFVVPFRKEIGGFIADVVQSWDARTVSDRLEIEVGRDLQYIRMNGTLVGALAGVLLFLLTGALF